MRILVIGAGAVGGYYGARLLAAGHAVAFLARGDRLQALRSGGLRLRSPRGDLELPQVDARPHWDGPPPDLTLIAVKAYDTEAALGLCPPDGAVLTLQNGVENAERVLAAAGPERALGGACQLEVDSPAPGLVVHSSPFDRVGLGPLHPRAAPAAAEAAAAFAAAGVDAVAWADGRTAMWRKAMMLSPLSALTTLLDRPWGAIRAEPAALGAAEAMAREIAAVGTALGVPELGPDAVAATLDTFRALPATMTSSLQRDRRRGRPLEVEDLQGAIVRAADRAGISAPVAATLYGCLRVLAAGPA